jgi:hypothetical protein
MSKSVASFIFLLMFAGLPARADLTIIQKVEGNGQPVEIKLQVKGEKMRADVSPEMSVISDGARGESLTLMHKARSYLRIPDAEMQKLMAMAGQNGAAKPAPPQLKSTGRHQQINGHDAEEFVADFGKMKTSFWIARDFPGAKEVIREMIKFHQRSAFGRGNEGWGLDPSQFPGVPVRTETDLGGRKITSTVVSVSQDPVDEKIFAVPADYQALPSPAFGVPGGAPGQVPSP